MAVTNGTMTVDESGDKGIFQLPISISKSGDTSVVLNTEEQYLDKNIGITITTPSAGTFNVSSISGSSDVSVGSTKDANNKYTVTANNISVTGAMSTAGWVGTGNLTDSDTDGCTIGKIIEATASNAATGSASITSLSYAYDSTSGKFNVTGSGSISGTATLTVSAAGYLPKANITGSTTGTASLSGVTVNKIAGSTSITTGTGTGTDTATKKPAIQKEAISISGVVDAANDAATTTAPSSGVYVAVKSPANTGKLTATPSVSSAGYGTASAHGISARTATYGAAASDVTYIPITTATPAFDGGAISGTATAGSFTNATINSNNTSGVSFTTGGTITRGDVLYNGAVSGWVTKSDNATALAGGTADMTGTTYYINAVSVPANKTFTATATGTVSVTSASNSAGTIKVNAYPASGTTKDGEKTIVSGGKWQVSTVSAAGTYYYGKVKADAGTITNNTSGGTSTGTINRGSQIKIGAGFYASDTYYTAQANSGKITITSSGDTTVDGYATATVAAASFANSASNGVTYTDYDSSAPVLASGGYLYINAGYTPARKISLAKLVPNEADVGAAETSANILTGHSAYNIDGKIVAGSMAIYNGNYTITTT